MSGYNTSELARVMLGGFGQGANMVTSAAQILDQRARAAQAQQRYEQEVEYRRRQEQVAAAQLLSEQTALANFAETQGIFAPAVDPMAYGPQQPAQSGAPSPSGPYQPGMEPMASPLAGAMGLDRATIMAMDPASARGIITGAVKHRRDMEMAQFKADIDDQIERQKLAREMAQEASFVAQARQAGFSETDIQRSLLARKASNLGTPAGVVGDVFGNQPEQPYQMTAPDWQTLGVPGAQPSGQYGPFTPGTEPMMREGPAEVLARSGASLSEGARFIPKPEDAPIAPEQVDADVTRFVRTIEGPGVDLANPSSWTKLNPTGVEIMRLKMHRGETVTDTVLKAMLPAEEDTAVRIRFLRDQATMRANNLKALMSNAGAAPEAVAKAERLWTEAQQQYGEAAMGAGYQAGGAQSLTAPTADEIVSGNGRDIMLELQNRLGRMPTEDELTDELTRRAGGG